MSRAQPYAALLRGINLGARNKVKMPDLRAIVEDVGGEGVTTYLQSGNVVFRSTKGAAALGKAIEQEIARRLQLDIAVLLRTGPELARVVAGNPFSERQDDPLKLHLTFLAATPERERVAALDPTGWPPDELHVAAREVYLHCPEGYGRSKLSNAFFEKRLGVVGTTRNWRTVTALAELTA